MKTTIAVLLAIAGVSACASEPKVSAHNPIGGKWTLTDKFFGYVFDFDTQRLTITGTRGAVTVPMTATNGVYSADVGSAGEMRFTLARQGAKHVVCDARGANLCDELRPIPVE